jgi:hypothetical protein
MSETAAASPRRPWTGVGRGDLAFAAVVVLVYVVAAVVSAQWRHDGPDRMMAVAERVLAGHLDSPSLAGSVDSVDIGGKYYIAVGPLQILAYLPFAAVPALHAIGGYLAGLLLGIPAAVLTLPLARAYGARGSLAYWVAGLAAFGTLLFFVSLFGNFYYLAHVESFLALVLFLIEWAGRRRPAVLGLWLTVSVLARPTTVLAAVPFGIALLWQKRDAVRTVVMAAVAFALPIGLALAFYGWYDWVRFGSPLQAGYAISYLPQPGLGARRALGVFSILQVPENFRLAFLAPFETMNRFPYLRANPYGLSMLLVSPALLTALWAGFRDRMAQILWIAAALVAIPVFLYYGGGYVQYGFRYSLDFTPFLVALVAVGSNRWRGPLERVLVVVSVASVTYGVFWYYNFQLLK